MSVAAILAAGVVGAMAVACVIAIALMMSWRRRALVAEGLLARAAQRRSAATSRGHGTRADRERAARRAHIEAMRQMLDDQMALHQRRANPARTMQ